MIIKKKINNFIKNYFKYNETIVDETPDEYEHEIKSDVKKKSGQFKLKKDDIKLIAFFLPQYHEIPENNQWWGDGFTEWTNVKKAIPQFKDHYQPHIPLDIGYYNLNKKETLKKQIELAKIYGIYGFCFHHYWFGGKRLLEKPLNIILENKDLNIPFCICWANENWTRKWDGLNNSILIAQEHSAEDDINFIKDASKYLNDPRYIRIDNKPVLIIYRIELFPEPSNTIKRWRTWAKENGFEGLYLIGAQGFTCKNTTQYGLDAAVEFPPNGMYEYHNITKNLEFTEAKFLGKVTDYRYYVDNKSYLIKNKLEYKLYKTVMPSWDNTPRRGKFAHVFYNSSPELYKIWLEDIITYTKENHSENEQFVFINAWNEWGEGAHLEPDVKYGYEYLRATREAIVDTRKINKKIIYVSHDAQRNGAQLLSLNIVKFLKEKFGYEVNIILINGGPLELDFNKYGKVYNINNNIDKASIIIENLKLEIDIAICNTVISGELVQILKEFNYKVISLVHELPILINKYKANQKSKKIATYSDFIVFPSKYVQSRFNTVIDQCIDNKSEIIPQGIYNYKEKSIVETNSYENIKNELNLQNDCKVVLGVGYGDERKGIDLFITIANNISYITDKIYFLWVGEIDKKFINKSLNNSNIKIKNKNLIFINYTEDIQKYYSIADLYLLTSREDPFPSVVLESMFYKVPVIGFDNAGGFTDIVKNNATGFIVKFEDIYKVQETILNNIYNEKKLKRLGENCSNIIAKEFNFYDYIYKLLKLLDHDYKKISVIVPNYNYEQYIVNRLKNIESQTYPLYEVIYLDDYSTDNSNLLVKKYIMESNNSFILEFNNENSNCIYKQWQKGLSKAKGDYIWIAEADDLCNEYFLENVTQGFKYNNVVISYCQSSQINEFGNLINSSYLEYTDDIDNKKWKFNYLNNGSEEIKACLSIKNTIPNISAVVFKKIDTIDKILLELFNYRIAGDWIFYIKLLEYGDIYFNSKALNYHRRHENSITKKIDNKIHFNEIVNIQNQVLQNYQLSDTSLKKILLYRDKVKKYLMI